MTIPNDSESNFNLPIPYETWRRMAYPFAYNEKEILDLFNLNNSNFILKEVNYELQSSYLRPATHYCSMFCLQMDIECNTSLIDFTTFHRQFQSISGLQVYSQLSRCMKCCKYLTIIVFVPSYPTAAVPFYSYRIKSREEDRIHTIHS